MKYWNVYCIANDNPIVTIIICVNPSPRRRNGCHINRSWIHPANPHAATTTTPPNNNGRPPTRMNAYPNTPPRVTSSACAKFDNPVVP